MKWLMVGRTVEPVDTYGGVRSVFVLINEEDGQKPVRRVLTVGELASAIKAAKEQPVDDEPRCIKNDLPAIVWLPDDTLADTFLECRRLNELDLHRLMLLLRK